MAIFLGLGYVIQFLGRSQTAPNRESKKQIRTGQLGQTKVTLWIFSPIFKLVLSNFQNLEHQLITIVIQYVLPLLGPILNLL